MKYATFALLGAVAAKREPFEFSESRTFNSSRANVTENTYFNPDTNTTISEMRRKYEDYFAYSFEAKNVTNDVATNLIAECSTSTECDNSNEMTQCCVNTVLLHSATGTQDVQYRCMSKGAVDANIDMQLGDFKVNMKCIDSGAAYLAVSASMVTLSAMALF